MSISNSSAALVAASVSQIAADKTAVLKVTGSSIVSAAADRSDGVDSKKPADAAVIKPEQIRQSLDDINTLLSARSVSVQFRIDPGYKDAILQVVDQQNGAVLLQLPSVEAVRIAKMMEQMKGVLIAQKV